MSSGSRASARFAIAKGFKGVVFKGFKGVVYIQTTTACCFSKKNQENPTTNSKASPRVQPRLDIIHILPQENHDPRRNDIDENSGTNFRIDFFFT